MIFLNSFCLKLPQYLIKEEIFSEKDINFVERSSKSEHFFQPQRRFSFFIKGFLQ